MVSADWPWLALAGLGALHGLNPAGGWLGAAACGLRARAVGPIALGHLASLLLVAGAAVLRTPGGRPALQLGAGVLWVMLAVRHVRGRHAGRAPKTGRFSLALSSFMASTAHGAGLMLVPTLAPLCLAGTPARELTASGSIGRALAAVGVHAAAMLLVSGVMASAAGRVGARMRWVGRSPRGGSGGRRHERHRAT